ncbi:MAG: hypothetical protein KDA55_07320 [Planctomycetales bacterium]|nr:hypothetical protein [Planctomycetales bacterium]MCA9201917.1 hypothetical protein [Planctomycetales bacterium]MCA9208149.1 hypothetical protein [Planctomycetales bacterium]
MDETILGEFFAALCEFGILAQAVQATRPAAVARRAITPLFCLLALFALWTWARPPRAGANVVESVVLCLFATYLLGWIALVSVSRLSRRVWLFRFVAASLAIVLVGVVGESLVLVGVDYSEMFSTAPWHSWKARQRHDAELLHLHRPHERFVGSETGGNIAYYWNLDSQREYRFDITTDANGFRNSRAYDQADVTVVGDSFVEAREVLEAETATSLLSERLNRVVVNLGQTGYGPQQELVVLRRFALPLEPKVCVWVFFAGNDLQDALEYAHVGDSESPNPLSVWRKRSFVVNLSRSFGRVVGRPAPDALAAVRFGDWKASSAEPVRMYFLEKFTPLDDRQQAALEMFRDSFSEAQRLCRANDCRLVFVYAPIKFRVYRDLCEFPGDSECLAWTESELPTRVREIVAAVDPEIPYLDLTEPLAEAAKASDELLYFPDDTHWTPAGHRVVADEIARIVRPLLP